MLGSRSSDNEISKRDIPSFIEPRPPLISNPFMRPKPQKGTNLLELFEEDSECEEPELVQVYLRLKPCNKLSNLYEIRSDRCLITSLDTTTAGHGRRTQHNVSKMYTFSHIFGPDSDQKEIFEHVVKDNLKRLPEGHSFTLLTYGASGSGKTYTLMGTVSSPGLVPRALEYVFKVVDASQTPEFKPAERGADRLNYAEQNYELQWIKRLRQISAPLREKYRRMSAQLFGDLTSSTIDLSNRKRHYVWVSFIEIYNEGIYDLLAPGDRKNASKLAIREDSSGNVYVKGATQTFVKSGEEAYDVMVAGKHNLQVAATGIHAQSSRSHCIFTITMLTETEEGVRSSCVRLCDLAGCERAARTRNTGARMHESRAINSSLHVLERCLRTLRKRAPAGPARAHLVPYSEYHIYECRHIPVPRESKLTRLLGAGLSGSRGEAVSMVVTLNPAPEYAQETRHVLQLAAVARDIQINNTLAEYPSSFESSTQDTTITCSTDLMKLRADNERLHFELLQTQSRVKELQACMEERQASVAHTMHEVVEEAKSMTREYYEAQIQALREEMEELIEEYESRLNTTDRTSDGDTLSHDMQLKINQLMTENAILQEKYSAEKLARARAEEEVQHLRACIEERDEKIDEEIAAKEDLVDLSDSDNSDDEDPCNESLEPTFKKEDINRSKMIQQSAIIDLNSLDSQYSDNSELENTGDTLKDEINTSYDNDCAYETGNDASINISESFDDKNKDLSIANEIVAGLVGNKEIKLSRETYCVESKVDDYNDMKKANASNRATYCVASNKNDVTMDVSYKALNCNVSKDSLLNAGDVGDDKPGAFINNIISSIKESNRSYSNNSLALFERLEQASKTDADTKRDDENFFNFKTLKDKRKLFADEGTPKSPETPATVVKSKDRKFYFDNIDASIKIIDNETKIDNEGKMKIDDYRSPSIVKEDLTNDFEPSMIKKLLGQSVTKQADALQKVKLCEKKCQSMDLFEGLDSPQVLVKQQDEVIENVRKSIQSVDISKKNDTIPTDETDIDIKNNESIEKDVKEENIVPKKEDNLCYIYVNVNKINTDSEVKDTNKNDEQVIAVEDLKVSEVKVIQNEAINNEESRVNSTKSDNTIDEFENIYKDITAPRATEFDLLVSQEIRDSTVDNMDTTHNRTESEEVKYNLRHKSKMDIPKTETRRKKKVLETSPPKYEKEKPKKRNLRLRRRHNASENNLDLEKDESKDKDLEEQDEKNRDMEKAKLKDIVNLQNEFSDVTLDKVAPIKNFKDIPSPEKNDNENQPPVLGVQSCPAKSTRNRRKLFTPRPEPLEESMEIGGSNERLHVPRPSYHKQRVRRKL
ncbi:unnamed protein product, partial [Brenthis ino]